ncbi:mannose-1-phosphate guanylyltransferase/mannose-6-phosphate isomerase [Thiofaba sp. EF100]|uniref:mannose-1-phosphate guanylyltransferase/mannose-6-phosphate isomerase n=1 Tax=Thiofaba sp. EF100 TaxID=3121274 RepID=UPI003221BCE3
MIIPVVLSGGVGSRLWPVSREAHPKPFMRLADGESLLQKTFLRACALPGVEEILTVTNRELYFKTADEYRPVNHSGVGLSYILEPFGRNTAAAIAAAALDLSAAHGDDALMLVLAADHLITKIQAFEAAVRIAADLARQGHLVTFGIQPEHPETGFGYIEASTETLTAPGLGGFKVRRFIEKPDLDKAREYLASGRHFWNSGMFCFQVGTLLKELNQHAPDVLQRVARAMESARKSLGATHRTLELAPASFEQVPDISIDYALMEKSEHVAVVTCDIGWSDIGSWNALSELTPADAEGNRIEGEALLHATQNCYIHSPERLTAAVGLDNLIIIDTADALLVAHKDRAQDVRHIARQLKESGHSAHQHHMTVHRPWGTYTVLEEGERFKIKRIVVKPGASLSLQMHHHRSEHWIVVNGMARVTNGERVFLLNTNESTFIPAGHVHRLENPGVIDLVMIEVQSGDYLGEDDIVRFEDSYGRS